MHVDLDTYTTTYSFLSITVNKAPVAGRTTFELEYMHVYNIHVPFLLYHRTLTLPSYATRR